MHNFRHCTPVNSTIIYLFESKCKSFCLVIHVRMSLARLMNFINILITKFQLKNVLVFIENSNSANKKCEVL